ncbi:MAG: hypothetical protein WBD45_06695, partial [Terriglobales bacterium]
SDLKSVTNHVDEYTDLTNPLAEGIIACLGVLYSSPESPSRRRCNEALLWCSSILCLGTG